MTEKIYLETSKMEIEEENKNSGTLKTEESMEIENGTKDSVLIYYFGTNYYEMYS